MAKKIIELSDPKLRSLLSNQIENALGYLGGNLSQSRRKSLDDSSSIKVYDGPLDFDKMIEEFRCMFCNEYGDSNIIERAHIIPRCFFKYL